MKRKDTSKQETVSLVQIQEDARLTLLKEENDSLKRELYTLKKELEQLKKPKAEKILLSDETIIAELQLGHIKKKALLGELTLEEIKKYDLLVKNKKLSEGNPTMITDYKRLPENIEEKDLVLLASSHIVEEKSK